MRKEPTIAERAMWRVLKNGALAALNWRKQAPFGPYILDFVSHPACIVVEVDGGQHNQPEQLAHDRERTVFLERQGYRVLRFWNNEVLTNADGVFRVIIDAASKSPANPRMDRWKADWQAAFAAQVANLPLDGGGGERMRAGAGDRSERSDLPLEAQHQNAERTPPPALRASSPIEGAVRVQPGLDE